MLIKAAQVAEQAAPKEVRRDQARAVRKTQEGAAPKGLFMGESVRLGQAPAAVGTEVFEGG